MKVAKQLSVARIASSRMYREIRDLSLIWALWRPMSKFKVPMI
jgi:hypothetical protein